MQEENQTAPTEAAAAPEQTPETSENAGETTAATGEQTAANAEAEPTAAPEQITETAAEPEPEEDITYQAVQKDGHVTAIWEMQGRRHLRTIDPRSREGEEILRLFTAEDHEQEHTEEAAA